MLIKFKSKMDAKKARRNAKSSLTRRSNNLYSMPSLLRKKNGSKIAVRKH